MMTIDLGRFAMEIGHATRTTFAFRSLVNSNPAIAAARLMQAFDASARANVLLNAF